MPGLESHESTCRRQGVVLTCYVDGKKRFRAVRSFGSEPCDASRPVEPRDDADQAPVRPAP